jgi:scyllo-inositol 2-dehydrogenase (NADP+)
MGKIFSVAFCGAGGIVRGCHLPALEERPDRYKVVGFYDVKRENAAERAGDRYKVYEAYEELCADAEVDLVVIATKPLTTHYPTAKQALEAGKHVVLEKPMASTTAECDELIALAEKQKVVFTIPHNRRLNLDFLALRDVLARGKIGEPVFVETRIGSGGYDGGDLVDWGIHLVDQALLLNTSPLVEVSAFFRKPEGGRDDAGFAEATFRFEKPPVTRVAMMPYTKPFLQNGENASQRFYAAGTGGAFTQRVIEDCRDVMNALQNWDKARPDYAVPDYIEMRHKWYYDYLYESLADGAPLLVEPREARNAIRAMELMEESAQAGKTIPASNMLKL